MPELDELRFEGAADVYKNGVLAAVIQRRADGSTEFDYRAEYPLGAPDIASTLPRSTAPVIGPAGTVPAFFAGLLPEGRRLTLLRDAVKSSLSDELTLLLAVGADVPGDVQIVPAGQQPVEPEPLADLAEVETLDLMALTDEIDRHGLPGVQEKLSAQMISAPLALGEGRFIVKLDPRDYPRLVANELLHLAGVRALKLPVTRATLVRDRLDAEALLAKRFDREKTSDGWRRLALEDATQALGLPPASKYLIDSVDAVDALAGLCTARAVAVRNLYLQFVFAWLTGNGDLHGKNISVLGDLDGRTAVAPVYDIPCTLLYGDDSLALPVAGKTKNLKARHWAAFAHEIGLPDRATASANALALAAAAAIDLTPLGFTGSPLNGTLRELSFRRAELATSSR